MYKLRITTRDSKLMIRKTTDKIILRNVSSRLVLRNVTQKIKVGASVKRGLKGETGEDGQQGIQGIQGEAGTTDYNELINKPALGTAAFTSATDYATTTQGTKADTAVQPAQIADFETTTELNARDTANRSRANHIGTQPISSVIGLQSALDSKSATDHTHTAAEITDFSDAVSSNLNVSANTSARHTHTNSQDLDAVSGTNTGDQVGDGVTITGAGTELDPFVSVKEVIWGTIAGDIAVQEDLNTLLSERIPEQTLFIQDTEPTVTSPSLWVETASGAAKTIWIVT